MRSGTNRTLVRKLWMMSLVLVFAGSFMLPTVSAAGMPGVLAPLVTLAATLLVGGILLAVIGYILGKFGGEPGEAVRDPLVAVGAVLAVIGIVGMVLPYVPWGGLGGDGGGGDGYVPSITCMFDTLAAGGPGGAHDADTEYPSGNGFVAADGGTPDHDSTIATPIIIQGNKEARIDLTIEDEAAAVMGTGTNNDAWLPEDSYAFDVNCKLNNPQPGVAVAAKSVNFYGQLTFDYVMGRQGNMTTTPVFWCDTAGVYAGFGLNADSGAAATGHDANHQYVSYRNSKDCTPTTQGDAISLGPSSTATPQNGEWFSIWYLMHAGIISYEETTATLHARADFWAEDSVNGQTVQSNKESVLVTWIATDD